MTKKKEIIIHKSEIKHQKSEIINQNGKQTNLEQGIASNYYYSNRDSNHLRGNLMHGHVTKQERV